MREITTLLFDCDNTLVLSEDLAFDACAGLLNEICKAKNVKASFTGEFLINTYVGQNFRGMLGKVQKDYEIPLTDDEVEEYVGREMAAVIAKLETDLVPCVGVTEQLENLEASKKYEMAVVSSSATERLETAVKKVGQDKYFPKNKIFSAASSLEKPTTKPDPAIYLFAMEKLGKKAEECVAIEDSKSGALSANKAKIKTIGYTGPYRADKKKEAAEVLKEAGVAIVMDDWSEFPACLAKIVAGEV